MLFCRLLIFSKSTFSKNSFRNIIRVLNSLDPNQALHFVGPDLGPNCLQRLTTNCYLSNDHSPVVLGREEGDTNVVSLSDIVTTHTLDDDTIEDDSDNAIQIITEDNIIPSENMSMENVIRIEDMSSYVVNSYPNSSSQDLVLEASPVDGVQFTS